MGKGIPNSLDRSDVKGLKNLTVIVDTAVEVTATGSALGFGNVALQGLPAGNVLILAAIAKLSFDATGEADVGNGWEGDFAIGTTADANGTLAAGEVNVIPSTALEAGASNKLAPTTRAVSVVATPLLHNNEANDIQLFLNVVIDAADLQDDAEVDVAVKGTLSLCYVVLP